MIFFVVKNDMGFRGRITKKANVRLLAGRAGWTVTLVGERQDGLSHSNWQSNRIHNGPLSRYTGGTHLRINASGSLFPTVILHVRFTFLPQHGRCAG